MKKVFRNKKGTLRDVIMIGILLLFFSLVVLFGFKISSEWNDAVQANPSIPANAKTASASLTGQYATSVDNGFLLLAVGLAIGTLILASLVRIHPIFIPIFFIGLVIVVFMCGVFSNIYQGMAADPNLIAQADQLVLISHILTFLPLIVCVFGILLMVVMFKIWSIQQQ